jgi:molybdate transport system regulatory protein
MQYLHNGRIMNIKIKSKLWIEADGKPIFGSGKIHLLEAIDKYGSINRGAKETNMSYRKAWAHLNAMEERLDIKLIERRTGGKDGGGATLTKNAKNILSKYRQLEKGLQKIVDDRFTKIFRKNVL